MPRGGVGGARVEERLEIDPGLAVKWTAWRIDKSLPMLVPSGS